MDDFGSLLILIFLLWPLLAGLLGRARKGRQPPPGRPRQRPQPRGQVPQPRRSGTEEPATAGPSTASDMIPDELWEILTGEKRRPAPVSAPPESSGSGTAPGRYEPEFELEEPGEEEWERSLPSPPEPRPARMEVPRPAESLEVEPVIVSLEQPLPPAATRHTAFHTRLEALPSPAAVVRRRRRRPLNLGGLDELRRMVVLREVLGPPKALE